jgi:hypothetical protein
MRPGTLYVVPVLNSMGPVVDARHSDLLESWDAVDAAMAAAFTPEWRRRFPDSRGNGIALSYFCISWSGFKSNPVQRDFGWHTIFDHYKARFGADMAQWGDGLYWMYNHPPASGVGNEWGLDWLHNSHYFNILNHFVIDRGFFPSCVEVPTERNDTSHVLEDWIPFDYGNRNSVANRLDSVNADGKLTGVVIDWRNAPHDWSHYHPSHDNYQLRGRMMRTVFRIVDIKSIVHVIDEVEIERAFLRCLEGHDTVLCAYEHDFRDRYQTIMDLLIEPVHRLHRRYHDVDLVYANARDAAKAVLRLEDATPPELELQRHDEGLRVTASKPLFGAGPYVAVLDTRSKQYFHLPLARLGERTWRLPDIPLPSDAIVGLAAHDRSGNVAVGRWRVRDGGSTVERLEAAFQPPDAPR